MIYEVKILNTAKKDIKKLSKKYPKIKFDLLELIDLLETNPFVGISLGESFYKIRVKNSSINKGKSGGFRIIYYIVLDDKEVLLLKFFSKSDIENLSHNEIVELLKSNIEE